MSRRSWRRFIPLVWARMNEPSFVTLTVSAFAEIGVPATMPKMHAAEPMIVMIFAVMCFFSPWFPALTRTLP